MGSDAPLLLPLRQPIPLARSILWSPASAEGRGARKGLGNIPFPIFLRQAALVAVHEHLGAPARAGQGLFGFLVGDLCECPETNVSYVVIDSALQLNQPIYSDRTMDVVTRIWDRIEAQAAEQKGHLIGWYHTHTPLPLALSTHDVETHKHHFPQAWQVALVVGTSGEAAEPAAGFFRVGSDETSVSTPLPFYEVLSEESIRPGGKKRSFVTWKNYRAYNPVADRAPRAPPKAGAGAAAGTAGGSEGAPEPPAARETQPPKVTPLRTDELAFLTAAQESWQPPARETPPPETAVPKSDELVFLTAAEDSAHPPPSPAPPSPAPPPPPPPREARRERPAPPAPPPPPPRPPSPPPSARRAPPEPAEEEEVEESEQEVEEQPHPLTPFPQREPYPLAPARRGEGEPHPLTPSPQRGEGEREGGLEERPEEPVVQPVVEERPRRVRTARRSGQVRRWLRVAVFAILVAGAGAGYLRFKPSLPSLPKLPFLKRQATARASAPSPSARRPSRPDQRSAARTSPPDPHSATGTSLPDPRSATRASPPDPLSATRRGGTGGEFDAVAQPLTQAVRSFRERAALFDRGQVACGGLARALLAVEERWATYSTTRRASRVADNGQAGRDHALYAGVDSVERRFERSGCPRL